MINFSRPVSLAIAAAIVGLSLPARADTNYARCDYYPRGEDRAEASMSCVFSQRQGFVTIQGEDGRRHEFAPDPNRPLEFRDRQGRRVYLETDTGLEGIAAIYRTETQSIYVYWDRGTPPDASRPEPAIATGSPFDEEITCRIADEEIAVLKNSRGQLIFQGHPDLMPDNPIVVVGGRIVRGDDYIDRIFERSGFRHTVRTTTLDGRPVDYYITERGNEFLDSQECFR